MIIVFDFDGTLFDLSKNIDWGLVKADESRRLELEMKAVKGRRLQRPIMSMLDELGQRYRLAVYSRNLTEPIRAVLRASLVDEVYVVGRDSGYIKPDVRGLEAIAEYYGSEEIVMVGDSWHDKATAFNYGCPYIPTAGVEQTPMAVSLFFASVGGKF